MILERLFFSFIDRNQKRWEKRIRDLRIGCGGGHC